MKKQIFIFTLVLAILILPLASSMEIQMPSQISQGQTAIAKVEGNFLDPIQNENIKFYRGEIGTSFVHNVGKIGGVYYIYFQTLGKSLNNYSISIEGVRYYVGAQISNDAFSKNFSISSESADFSIDKSFVVTDTNFSITVQNLNSGTITISIDSEFSAGSSEGIFSFFFKNDPVTQDSVTLLSGDIEDIKIDVGNISETTTRTINLSTENTEYEIVAYVIAHLPAETENTSVGNESTPTEETNETSPIENETVVEENETITENKTEDKKSFWDIFKKENTTPETQPEETENTVEEYEIVTDSQGNEYAVNSEGDVINAPASSKTCSQNNGVICSSSQICQNDNITYAKDAKCCLSACVKESSGKNGKIVGWALIGLIVLLLIWFRMKFKKTRRRKFKLPR